MKEFIRYKLPNGARVILVPEKGSVATTVAVLVEAGSKYETKDLNGLSHFLEHMCFKGTTKRPHALDISSELDGLGAVYNAFTAQEMTSYYAKARNEIAPRLLEIVSDLYLNPTFDAKEIEKEKGVIIEELNMYEDTPRRRVGDLFMEAVYGDQPAGWDIGGRKEVIRRLTRNDFLKYRNAHYLAQSTVLVVSGGFDVSKMKREIAARFGALRRGTKEGKLAVHESQKRPMKLVKYKKVEQTHLVMGFRAFDIFDKRRSVLQALADILGGGMGSRLWQIVREQLGAAYYVNASTDFFTDHGLITMSAGVRHEKLPEVIAAGLKEFDRFTRELVAPADLKRAKDHLIGTFLLSLETSDELGYYYGTQEAMGLRLMTPAGAARELKAVTADDIRRVARALFRNDRLNLALIGPLKDVRFKGLPG